MGIWEAFWVAAALACGLQGEMLKGYFICRGAKVFSYGGGVSPPRSHSARGRRGVAIWRPEAIRSLT